jgi:hypothetical protein
VIPDFPAEKAKLMKIWTKYLVQKHRELLGFFSTLPSYTHHEGDRWRLIRSDNASQESEYSEMGGEFSVRVDEVPDLTPDKIAEKIDRVAEDMARQVVQRILSDIEKSVDESGRSINAGGKEFTKDLFLQALDSIELSFEQSGELIPPSVIMPPNLWEARKEEIMEWEQDPEFVARRDEIINRKRDSWHARESRRKLVD